MSATMGPPVTATVEPCANLRGVIRVPGDKSVSQRVAMLAGLCAGESRVDGYLQGEDCLNTLQAMVDMGARSRWEGDRLFITGTGGVLHTPAKSLWLGNSGTGIRLLSGLVSGFPVRAELTGDPYLCNRPMERIRRPLVEMGARIELTGEKGTPPIRIQGGGLRAIRYETPMASAQVKSCILLAALNTTGVTTVVEPAPTRDYTERLLRSLGVNVRAEGNAVHLEGLGEGGIRFTARDWNVPGDFSSAAFWIAAGALREGSDVTIENVGLNPRRTALLDVLRRMGADIRVDSSVDATGESIGTVRVRGGRLRGTTVLKAEIPILIDELPLIASIGALAEGETSFRDAAELRVKESDRIATTAANLRALGVAVEEFPDGMTVRGAERLTPPPGAETKSYGDHRIAMSMAILALHAESAFRIHDVEPVKTSYPTFWDHLATLGGTARHA